MIPPPDLLLPQAADPQWKQERAVLGAPKTRKRALGKQVVG